MSEQLDVTRLFTRSDGSYAFARWNRPIAPVVFGVEDQTVALVKDALQAVATLANMPLAETDPELGANMMWFFLRDWSELTATPDLDQLIPELPDLITRLQAAGANQYRIFRFDPDGAIRACFVFIRMDAQLADVPADTLALGHAVQSILLWSDTAFAQTSPLAIVQTGGPAVLRPEIADVIRAGYAAALPAHATDASHALRLQARLPSARR
ncbi:hypothetical protein SAMN06273572_101882 [Monaibacterium marinum]|uniref:Uncharacterized protein n=1 Tax=Pontivivens marinum TaxID=1690039 RepID=A0A2C9CP88_9RHOB|nr:hypothetical protein [Monaibacterium marinum]SOH93028.1 hypothetical protein SAMN06273572_101882 [Monaibacterium marinum]